MSACRTCGCDCRDLPDPGVGFRWAFLRTRVTDEEWALVQAHRVEKAAQARREQMHAVPPEGVES